MDILNDAINKKLEAGVKADGINAPKEKEYVMSRGKRLHVRTNWNAIPKVIKLTPTKPIDAGCETEGTTETI